MVPNIKSTIPLWGVLGKRLSEKGNKVVGNNVPHLHWQKYNSSFIGIIGSVHYLCDTKDGWILYPPLWNEKDTYNIRLVDRLLQVLKRAFWPPPLCNQFPFAGDIERLRRSLSRITDQVTPLRGDLIFGFHYDQGQTCQDSLDHTRGGGGVTWSSLNDQVTPLSRGWWHEKGGDLIVYPLGEQKCNMVGTSKGITSRLSVIATVTWLISDSRLMPLHNFVALGPDHTVDVNVLARTTDRGSNRSARFPCIRQWRHV